MKLPSVCFFPLSLFPGFLPMLPPTDTSPSTNDLAVVTMLSSPSLLSSFLPHLLPPPSTSPSHNTLIVPGSAAAAAPRCRCLHPWPPSTRSSPPGPPQHHLTTLPSAKL